MKIYNENMKKIYLAIDIGASSGRHIIGFYDNNEFITDEVYRFPNYFEYEDGHKVWNINRLFKEILNGIRIALKKYQSITSMSIDTWGVDYVLLDENKKLLNPAFSYRDERTKSIIKEVHNLISFDQLYKITGTQFQEFNTIYQLFHDKKTNKLEKAKYFLMLPEYFMYLLTGKITHEYTNASTTGLLDCKKKEYSEEIINKLGLKEELFTNIDISFPGEDLGYFKEDIQKEVGGNIRVKLCATHDTASAVEGVNFNFYTPYISSGTWSLLGVKLESPIVTNISMDTNYTNEAGPNYIRFQKNIMGLWIIQNLSKQLNKSFTELIEYSLKSSFTGIFDVNDNCFLSTADMRNEIYNYFVDHNLNKPSKDYDVVNSAFHSLAYSYKIAIDELEMITGRKYSEIYIIGGGAKNAYLNELTAKYTKKKIIALPIEATSIGNLNVQIREENYEKRGN